MNTGRILMAIGYVFQVLSEEYPDGCENEMAIKACLGRAQELVWAQAAIDENKQIETKTA